MCHLQPGWLPKFKQRHGIRQLQISEDRASGYTEVAVKNLFLNSQRLWMMKALSAEQVYNADETGWFGRYVPRNTLATADEKYPTGIKDSKERILACANTAGSHKTKLFVIEKCKKPRAFKGSKE